MPDRSVTGAGRAATTRAERIRRVRVSRAGRAASQRRQRPGRSRQPRDSTRDCHGCDPVGAAMDWWPSSRHIQQAPERKTMNEIRPFRLDTPEEAIADLRRRIAATRWPTRELVPDRSQGVQLATIQELARYWTTD